jgi:hypothetical protein
MTIYCLLKSHKIASSFAGQTPFAPGQWKPFMASTAGLMVLQQFLRPLRFVCAAALTPLVGQMIRTVEERLGVNQRRAGGIMFALLAVTTLTVLGTALATVTILNMPQSA